MYTGFQFTGCTSHPCETADTKATADLKDLSQICHNKHLNNLEKIRKILNSISKFSLYLRKIVCGLTRQRFDCIGCLYPFSSVKAFQPKCIKPIVKQGGVVMSGAALQLHVLADFLLLIEVQIWIIYFSVHYMTLQPTWVMQRDGDLKHTRNSASNYLKKCHLALEWPDKSLELRQTSEAELKQFCK